MASPSNERGSNGISSYITEHGLNILLAVGAGYISRRLWYHANDSAEPKLVQLRNVPTIPISDLKYYTIPGNGQLVMLQNGVVAPLFTLPDAPNQKDVEHHYSKSKNYTVLRKTVEYTDEPKEYEDVYKGFQHVRFSRVPFALTEGLFEKKLFVIVKYAGLDHFPGLEHRTTVKSPLDPPVVLEKTITVKRDWKTESESSSMKSEHVAKTEIHRVSKVTVTSDLEAWTKVENVFGCLTKKKDGVFEIEPNPDYPEECFTMNKFEIERKVRDNADVIKCCGFGFGLLSFGLVFSGIYFR